MSIDFNLSKEIMEELTGSKYPTIFEFEREGQEKIKLVRYEDYLKLHSIIKEVREYIEKRKDTQKWRKESLKEKSTNIDIVLEHYRDILDILEKENDNGER